MGSTLLRGQVSAWDAAVDVIAVINGMLLLVGLWTPVVEVLGAVVEFSSACFWHPHDPWIYILLGALGLSLALFGPGAYSVDARLFGLTRIEIPDRKS